MIPNDPAQNYSQVQTGLVSLLLRVPGERGLIIGPNFAIGTVKGPVRKDNQDRAVVAHVCSGQPDRDLFVALVCDGMGGLVDGATAASIACSAFLVSLVEGTEVKSLDRLMRAAHDANNAVYREFKGRGGTTLTALAIPRSLEVVGIHVGDSRLYRRLSDTRNVEQLSQDDTLQGVLAQSQSSGEQGERSLLQYIGMGAEIQPHTITPKSNGSLFYLLTSDGAHNVEPLTFASVCAAAKSTNDVARRLLQVADATGSPDNASVVAIQPMKFGDDKSFEFGKSLTVWTPWDQLRVLIVEHSVEKPRLADDALPTVDKTPKPARKGGRRRSQVKEHAPKKAEQDEVRSGVKPQLRIKFGTGGSDSDEDRKN